MDVKVLIDLGMGIIWNKEHHVRWVDDDNPYNLNMYMFQIGSYSNVLMAKKNSRYCGVKMPTYDSIFPYYTFSLKDLQKMYDNGIISFGFEDKEGKYAD